MDWDGVIERNREALKRIVASLAALAGLTIGQSPPLWGRCPAGQRGVYWADLPQPPLSAEPVLGLAEGQTRGPTSPPQGGRSAVITLPRHLHRAVLRLLRPAEAAARRLVLVAARDLVVEPPPPRPRKPNPKAGHAALRALGIAVVMSPADHARAAAAKSRRRHPEARSEAEPRRAVLPLFDPPQYPFRVRRRTVPPHAAPRILSFDGATPHRLPPPPAPDDPIDAGRLALRLAALASALDDLPGQARRFARWRARRDAAGAQTKDNAAGAQNLAPSLPSTGRAPRPRVLPPASPRTGSARRVGCTRRLSPLRRGRPPGLSAANRRRPSQEVHEILADMQYFAHEALKSPDTS